MNARFAALLLVLACGTACAQDPRRDPSVHALAATRDLFLGQTTITGSYTNTGYATLPAPKVTFALYDADDHEIGRLVQHADADLAPGQTWDIRTTTPMVFARYIPVADVPPPAPRPAAASGKAATRKAGARATGAKAAAKPPVARPAVIYRKPELYDWSKHHRPASTPRATSSKPAATTTVTPAVPQRVSPAVRPGYTPRTKPAPSTKSVH